MDGRGRWMDNVMIEQLWRSLKYGCAYLRALEAGSEARAGIDKWGGYCNADRSHSSLDDMPPDEASCGKQKPGLKSKPSLAASWAA